MSKDPISVTPSTPSAIAPEDNSLTRTNLKRDEIRVVYFGTSEFSANILEKLINWPSSPEELEVKSKDQEQLQPQQFTIQAVVTRPDKPVGRKQIMTPSPVSLIASKYNIPLIKPSKLDEDFIKNHLSLLECELFVVAAYGKIISQKLLDIPTLGPINVHGSLLPKYRGASPIQTSILEGEKVTGITIILMDAEVDHGPILSNAEVDIANNDTSASLSAKLSDAGADLLIQTIPQFVSGNLKATEQDHNQATFTKMISKEDGFFDINNPPSPEKLDLMVRAFYPWPNAWTRWNGRVVKFLPEGLVQMEGKNPTPLKNFLNGYPDFPLTRLP